MRLVLLKNSHLADKRITLVFKNLI